LFRLLSKVDENIFQSVVNTAKATDHQVHPPQESSTSAISDVSFHALYSSSILFDTGLETIFS
jgi:hypothetical protein